MGHFVPRCLVTAAAAQILNPRAGLGWDLIRFNSIRVFELSHLGTSFQFDLSDLYLALLFALSRDWTGLHSRHVVAGNPQESLCLLLGQW